MADIKQRWQKAFFTIEQWRRAKRGAASKRTPVLHFDASHSVSQALEVLKQRGKTGLYRVVQTQRCIWAELESGTLRLHGPHALSPDSLARLVALYERERGRPPVEQARLERLKAKQRLKR